MRIILSQGEGLPHHAIKEVKHLKDFFSSLQLFLEVIYISNCPGNDSKQFNHLISRCYSPTSSTTIQSTDCRTEVKISSRYSSNLLMKCHTLYNSSLILQHLRSFTPRHGGKVTNSTIASWTLKDNKNRHLSMVRVQRDSLTDNEREDEHES